MKTLQVAPRATFISAPQIFGLVKPSAERGGAKISVRPNHRSWLMCSDIGEAAKASVFGPSPFQKYRIARSRSASSRSSRGTKPVIDTSSPEANVVARVEEEVVNEIGEESKTEDANTETVSDPRTRNSNTNTSVDSKNIKDSKTYDEMQFASHEDLMQVLQHLENDPLKNEGGRIVTYRGSKTAKLMIIGEAPGEMEDKLGKPFVGRAGELLDKIFDYGGFDTEKQIYVTNVVKRRPKKNRTPNLAEMQYYKPYLLEEIRLIQPAIVVLAGAVAAQALLGPVSITKARGNWSGGGTEPWMMPVFHPSYLLRNPIRKHDMVTDIEEIRRKYMQVVPHDTLHPLKR
ncbi:unnamed protein product [Agarophyton chilense]